MISKRYLRKYIKRMFNIDVDIYIQHHFWGGYGAKAYKGSETEPHVIEIVRSELEGELPRYLIWHEVGHLFTPNARGGVKCELEAQWWALQEAKKRGYKKLYKELVEYVREWVYDKISCAEDKKYKRAGRIILQRLGEYPK